MIDLLNEDVVWLTRRLQPAVKKVVENFDTRVFIGGGFIRSTISGENVNDVDMFARDAETASRLAYQINQTMPNPQTIFTTPNALTIRSASPAIQVISRWTFSSLDDCLSSFDFTIACAGIEYAGGQWVGRCHERFYQDLAAKRLVYLRPDRVEDEAGSTLRMLKFYGRGYRARLFDIASVVARAVKGMQGNSGPFPTAVDEDQVADFVCNRLRVVDPSADPEEEGHLG